MQQLTIENGKAVPAPWSRRWVIDLVARGALLLVGTWLLYLGIKVWNGGFDALLSSDVVASTITWWIAVPTALAVVAAILFLGHVLERRLHARV